MHYTLHLFNKISLTYYNYDGFAFPYIKTDLSIPIILIELILISILTIRGKSYDIFSSFATEQMRGLAILAIVLSHYITRIFITNESYYKYFKDSGGLGVGVFLILSGFGLMSSYLKNGLYKNYLFKRILKVMVPYWIFTVLWIILDIYLLNVHRSIKINTTGLLGITVLDNYTREINPSMWFITFIIF